MFDIRVHQLSNTTLLYQPHMPKPTQTLLPGKDAPLEETIEAAITSLASLGIELQETSYLNPVPHCWSVHIRETSCPALYTNGKGTSKLASRASGIGEFTERLATDFFFSDYYLGSAKRLLDKHPFVFYPDECWFKAVKNSTGIKKSYHCENGSTLLTPELMDFYDPENELTDDNLIDNNTDANNGEICALPFTDLSNSSTCYFPISLLNNLYVSNGMAAGNTPSECKSQALSEIIERYVKNIVIAQGLSLPVVPDDALIHLPHLLTIRETLIQNGFTVTIHDSSLGGKFPVICVLLVDNKTGGAFAAFGANCRLETAIERTLTELLQGRDLSQLHNFSFPVHNIDMVADQYNLESHFIDSDGLLSWSMFKDRPDYTFCPWSFTGNTGAEETELTRRIVASGFSIYLREYLHCGLYSCRIIVPGMSEIYPVDDLIWNNRNKGRLLRTKILQCITREKVQLLETLELLEDLALDDQLLLSHVIGVIFDDNCNWKTLRIGELKAHIYLALQDYHNAAEWCSWVVDYGGVKKQRSNIFRAITTLLQLNNDCENSSAYSHGVRRFFSDSDLQAAHRVINGKEHFLGLNFKSNWEEISLQHSRLITLYENLREPKAAFGDNLHEI